MQYVSGLIERGGISRESTGFVVSGCQFTYNVEVRDTEDKGYCKVVPVASLRYPTNLRYRSVQSEPTVICTEGVLGVVFTADANSGCQAIVPHTHETAMLHHHIDIEVCSDDEVDRRYPDVPIERWNYWSDSINSGFKLRQNLDFFGLILDRWGDAFGVRGNIVSMRDGVGIEPRRMYDLLCYLSKELGDGILTCKTLVLACESSNMNTIIRWHDDEKAKLYRTKMVLTK